LDMVELRKLILFLDDELTNNTSWRFVAADFVFPDVTNPFLTVFPEVRNINGLMENEQHDFIGVKIGDVNGSAIANSLVGGEDRSDAGQLYFDVADQRLEKGAVYEVSFAASDFNEMLGFQFALNFDASQLEWLDVKADQLPGMSSTNFGFSLLEEGVITASWNHTSPVSRMDGTDLFTFTFKAKADTRLQDCLNFAAPIFAEAYSKDDSRGVHLNNLAIRFNDDMSQMNELALFQNQPNPFVDKTTIGFFLPEATTATIVVYDVTGKVVHQVEGDYSKGTHFIALNAKDIKGQGVMYYQLKTSKRQLIKKMMLLTK